MPAKHVLICKLSITKPSYNDNVSHIEMLRVTCQGVADKAQDFLLFLFLSCLQRPAI